MIYQNSAKAAYGLQTQEKTHNIPVITESQIKSTT